MRYKKRYKIIIIAPLFLPSYGGMEQVADMLAGEWNKKHEVTVITQTRNEGKEMIYPYPVIRSISVKKLYKLIKKADFVILNGFSLFYFPFVLPFRKKTFAIHHTYYNDGINTSWKSKLKLIAIRFFHNISVSKAVAKHLNTRSEVIYNPYNNDIFYDDQTKKTNDIIFVGRLVTDKGCLILIKALVILKKENIDFSCTIIGDGPEFHKLKGIVDKNDLKNIIFAGALFKNQLADEIRRHKIMVVPSIWEEPFGIVVLEGLACGCSLVVSDKGGLPEALNGFGDLFEAGNEYQLASLIKDRLKAGYDETLSDRINKYLKEHIPSEIARQYIDYMESIL